MILAWSERAMIVLILVLVALGVHEYRAAERSLVLVALYGGTAFYVAVFLYHSLCGDSMLAVFEDDE